MIDHSTDLGDEKTSIGESIYSYLRNSILNLTLEPGTQLSIKKVAENMNISRSPVRDAFLKLGKERLLDIVPQSGTSVSKIDWVKVDEERFLRMSLEVSAIEEFIKRSTKSDIMSLYSNIERQTETLLNITFICLLF